VYVKENEELEAPRPNVPNVSIFDFIVLAVFFTLSTAVCTELN
jgi:hypothetical protein